MADGEAEGKGGGGTTTGMDKESTYSPSNKLSLNVILAIVNSRCEFYLPRRQSRLPARPSTAVRNTLALRKNSDELVSAGKKRLRKSRLRHNVTQP